MMAMDMRQLLDSMENTIKLQGRARAERRAREAEQEQKEFKEKLMRIAAGQNRHMPNPLRHRSRQPFQRSHIQVSNQCMGVGIDVLILLIVDIFPIILI